MKNKSKSKDGKKTKRCKETIVSAIQDKRQFIETIHQEKLARTAFVIWKNGHPKVASEFSCSGSKTYVPVKASNNLIKHKVILFPSFVENYESKAKLIDSLISFIHRYCDLGEEFETVSAHYILLTWVYDRFRELPYLRLQGDYGTGKSRFLQVVGSLCYKPLFASGASTISPIFHALDTFRGTLVMDEADFRFSDEKADVVKILNNGNMKGFPLLRSEVTRNGTYNPKAFHVFGPKILATRGAYQDPALESRIITRRAKSGHIRKDIPLTLPDTFEKEAETLCNKLLMFRFKVWHTIPNTNDLKPLDTGDRISQIFRPLLALSNDEKTTDIIRGYAKQSDLILRSSRAHSVEEHLLSVMAELIAKKKSPLSIKLISNGYRAKYGSDHSSPVTNKWIGGVLRNKLQLSTVKRNGIYITPETEYARLKALFSRYNIDEK